MEVEKNIKNVVGQKIMQNKIAVAISGGIDSFYALKFSLENFENITAVFLNFLNNKNQLTKVHSICNYLKVPLKIFDCKQEFEKQVIEHFANEYLKGRTPNPCVICNEKFKFQLILTHFEKIITGHYANIEYCNGKYFVSKGIDKTKEQSYFLARIKEEFLERIIFPLGNKKKENIKNNVINEYNRFGKVKESQEICFIPKNNYKNFLKNFKGIKDFPGFIMDKHGKKLGKHTGFYNFTIGQRKGLNIAMGVPYYVISIDAKNNIVYAGPKKDTYNKEFEIEDVLWYDDARLYDEIKVKVRYRTSEKSCKVIEKKVLFLEQEQAVTPGQLAVFYYKNIVLGSGWINAVL